MYYPELDEPKTTQQPVASTTHESNFCICDDLSDLVCFSASTCFANKFFNRYVLTCVQYMTLFVSILVSGDGVVLFPTCPNATNIGTNCSSSGTICDLQQPCLNSASCVMTNNNEDYYCVCLNGFTGKHCETKEGPCKRNSCINGTMQIFVCFKTNLKSNSRCL